MRPLIIHHNDADGFGAAWAAWKTLGDRGDYMSADYGDAPPDVEGREVYILDFSYKRDVLIKMWEQAHELVVLDHHVSSTKTIGDLEYVHLSDKNSGCVMAWRFFNSTPVPKLLEYVEDADLWNWQLPSSRAINAGLSSYDFDFATWETLQHRIDELRQDGYAILRREEQMVKRLAKNAVPVQLDGFDIMSVNSPLLQSQLGHELAKGKPFSVVWYEKPGMTVYSLRSDEGGEDVSIIAKNHGGGGHKHAAGFETHEW